MKLDKNTLGRMIELDNNTKPMPKGGKCGLNSD